MSKHFGLLDTKLTGRDLYSYDTKSFIIVKVGDGSSVSSRAAYWMTNKADFRVAIS